MLTNLALGNIILLVSIGALFYTIKNKFDTVSTVIIFKKAKGNNHIPMHETKPPSSSTTKLIKDIKTYTYFDTIMFLLCSEA